MPQVTPPFQHFTESDGLPLEAGKIYIGIQNLNPITNPITVYWDEALNIPAAQPIRTIGGAPSRNGSASKLYATSNYSILVKNRNDVVVYSDFNGLGNTTAENVSYLPQGTGAIVTNVQEELRRWAINVKDYGAMGDGVTNDIVAFNLAAAAASATGKALYIPGTNKYYRINSTFYITDDSFNVIGDGVKSCVVIHHSSGQDAIQVNGSHVSIRNIGIQGILGSGNGLHINGTTGVGENRFYGLWIGWVSGDGYRVTKGQSNIFTDCSVDQNSGYRPITLIGATEGNTVNAFNVLRVGGDTNNQQFVNCRSNAGAATGYHLNIGDVATGVGALPESINWVGGLMQGGFKGVYINGKDCGIINTHLEPTVGSYPNYFVIFEGARNCSISNTATQGDIQIKDSTGVGFTNMGGMGVMVTNSDFCYWHGGSYGNNAAGPTGGKILDQTGIFDVKSVKNASNGVYANSNNIDYLPEPFLKTYFNDFYDSDGSGTLRPYDLTIGTGTFSINTTQFLTGTRSYNVTPASDLLGGLIIGLPAWATSKKIYVEAWIFNADAQSSAYLVYSSSTQTVGQESSQFNRWERLQSTFTPDSTGTAPQIRLSGVAGQRFICDRITVWLEGWSERIERGYADVTIEATGGGTITLSATDRRLQYTKIGRQVTITGYLAVTAVSAPSGTLKIAGLPFACGSSVARKDQWTVCNVAISGSGIGPVAPRIISGQSKIEIFKYTAGNWADCASNIIGGTDIYVNATYFADV